MSDVSGGGRGISRRALLAGTALGATALSAAPARALAAGAGARKPAAAQSYRSGGHTVIATPLANADGSNPLVQVRDVNRVGQVLGMVDLGEGASPRWPSAIWANGRVTVLPSPVEGAADCGADRLNDRGQAAGYYTVGGREKATLWTGGVPRVLDIGTVHSRAFALNDAGQVCVRGYDVPSGETATWNTVCLVDGTAVTTVQESSSKGMSVTAVNDRGEVLVTTSVPQGGPHGAFLWRDGAVVADFTDVAGTPNYYGLQGVAGLDARGDVVGDYTAPGGGPDPRVFRWSGGELSTLALPGDGVFVSDPHLTRRLDDEGDFVGVSLHSTGNRAFLWSNGQVTDIGSLGGRTASPVDVNNARQVVGSSQRADGSYGCFLWRSGELIDVAPPPGYDVISVDAITEQGDLVGSAYATGSSGVCFRFTVL